MDRQVGKKWDSLSSKFAEYKSKEGTISYLKSVSFIDSAYKLTENLEIEGVLKDEIPIAYNNLLVNLVSGMEIYFRETIIQSSSWNEDGLNKLLQENIKLSEAYKIFNQGQITREYIIAQHFSFKNFDSISSVFSNLLGRDFNNFVEDYKFKLPNSNSLKEMFPNWRRDIVTIYNLRNNFVHECEVHSFDKETLRYYYYLSAFWIYYCDISLRSLNIM